MPKNSFKFFSNRDCRYFPCHEGADPDNFNCLFCYCPLDTITNCDGNFTVTKDGAKDCSQCVYPHLSENYGEVVKKVKKRLDEYPFPENGYKI